jgi:hypothetical protein
MAGLPCGLWVAWLCGSLGGEYPITAAGDMFMRDEDVDEDPTAEKDDCIAAKFPVDAVSRRPGKRKKKKKKKTRNQSTGLERNHEERTLDPNPMPRGN